MKYSSTISSKGQVTVPQPIRNRLGLSAGDRVEFVVEGERTGVGARRAPQPARLTSTKEPLRPRRERNQCLASGVAN